MLFKRALIALGLSSAMVLLGGVPVLAQDDAGLSELNNHEEFVFTTETGAGA